MQKVGGGPPSITFPPCPAGNTTPTSSSHSLTYAHIRYEDVGGSGSYLTSYLQDKLTDLKPRPLGGRILSNCSALLSPPGS